MCAPRRQNSELCRKKSRSLSCKHSCRATFHQRYLNFSFRASHTENYTSQSASQPVSQTPSKPHRANHTQSASLTNPIAKHRARQLESQPVNQSAKHTTYHSASQMVGQHIKDSKTLKHSQPYNQLDMQPQ